MFRKLMPVAALLAISSAALAETPAQARKAIEAIYAKEMAALARRDIDTVFAYQTPDYVAISKSGQRLSREQANQMGRQLTLMKSVDAKTKIVAFTLKGETALVRTQNRLRATAADPQTGKPLSAVIDGVEDDTWVKRSGKWLIKQSREITRTQKISRGK